MSTHRSNNRRMNLHQRRRAAIRRILGAFLRGRTDEDRAATAIGEAEKRGAK